MKPLFRCLLITLVVLAYLPPWLSARRENKASAQRTFVLPPPARPSAAAPDFKAELITPDPIVASVHVASVCETPNGKLCATWYGGSHEGARDVNIFWSTLETGDKAWSQPQVLVSRSSAMQELRRPIKKVGNAVLFASPGGECYLLYVSISIGGWSTSSLNVKTSRDAGKTWLPSQRLTLSPFFNLSELVKNNPCPLSDGSWVIPIYHECVAKFPELLWMTPGPGGEASWLKTRMFGGRSALQPALVPLEHETAIALCRDCSTAKRIQVTRSTDRGRHWSAGEALSLPNSDSGLDALRLSDGSILLAFNDSESGRENLKLAVSEDGGRTWSRRATLEEEAGTEFSYPYLIQANDEKIHIVYTWKRRSIKHAAFNMAWLNAQSNNEAQNRTAKE